MTGTDKIMTEIITAENCGFCFGVRRAVDMLAGEIDLCKKNNRRIYMLGKLIHNDSFINSLEAQGLVVVGDADINAGCLGSGFDFIEENSSVIIRAHGIPKPALERLEELRRRKNIKIVDATCECIKKMRKIAEENTNGETLTLIFGDKDHPEIVGLRSCVNGAVEIYKDFESLRGETADINYNNYQNYQKLIILAQTTHNINDYKKCRDHILASGAGENAVFFDTICDATEKRQAEAELLAKESDIMIVVGGRGSSNAKKLYEICRQNCANSFIIETSGQLPLNILKNLIKSIKNMEKGRRAVKVSITAGASTPDSIIMEVRKIMTDTINNVEDTIEEKIEEKIEEVVTEEVIYTEKAKDTAEPEEREKSFEELLNETFAPLSRGDRIKGIISYVSEGEIHVDIGYKYTGILIYDEITDDSSVDLKETFKIGDEIETQVIKTNDQEGIALLSKKRVDSTEIWDKIVGLHEDGTVVEGKVIQVVNGGIIVLIDTMKVFVPASHADVSKDTDLQTLIGRTVKVKIIDINTIKRRAIASIRNASAEERKAVEEKIWNDIEEGKRYAGTVKSIANYGAFVDIGGLDGMIHITELSWSRVKHPSEVLQLGDKVEVYIKSFDRERRRIALGYKDENANPWTKFTVETAVGDVVDAKILNMTPFGAFAEIVPGVDGLIHISQIVDKKISKPSEILNIGDIVQVKITGINAEAKQVALSMRVLLEPEPELELELELESEPEDNPAPEPAPEPDDSVLEPEPEPEPEPEAEEAAVEPEPELEPDPDQQ